MFAPEIDSGDSGAVPRLLRTLISFVCGGVTHEYLILGSCLTLLQVFLIVLCFDFYFVKILQGKVQ